jgi:hypothetical protein
MALRQAAHTYLGRRLDLGVERSKGICGAAGRWRIRPPR